MNVTVLITTVISRVKLNGGGNILQSMFASNQRECKTNIHMQPSLKWRDFDSLRPPLPLPPPPSSTLAADAACVGLYGHMRLCVAGKGLFPLPAEHMNGSSVRDGGADDFSA